jgi:hypothetical protein
MSALPLRRSSRLAKQQRPTVPTVRTSQSPGTRHAAFKIYQESLSISSRDTFDQKNGHSVGHTCATEKRRMTRHSRCRPHKRTRTQILAGRCRAPRSVFDGSCLTGTLKGRQGSASVKYAVALRELFRNTSGIMSGMHCHLVRFRLTC